MQFMILVAESPDDFAMRKETGTAAFEAYMKSWMDYSGEMGAAGVLISGQALQGPEAATTVRLVDGKRVVEDGPFADAKEQLGGYFIIDVADMDAAKEWAAKAPTTQSGLTVVRQVMAFEEEMTS